MGSYAYPEHLPYPGLINVDTSSEEDDGFSLEDEFEDDRDILNPPKSGQMSVRFPMINNGVVLHAFGAYGQRDFDPRVVRETFPECSALGKVSGNKIPNVVFNS